MAESAAASHGDGGDGAEEVLVQPMRELDVQPSPPAISRPVAESAAHGDGDVEEPVDTAGRQLVYFDLGTTGLSTVLLWTPRG